MSTNVTVKFYLKGKEFVGNSVCLDKLKNMLDGWSWGEELIPISNPDVKDAGVYWYENFKNYVPTEKIPEDMTSRIKAVDKHLELHLNKDEELPEELYANITCEILKSPTFGGDYVRVYNMKSEEYRGWWFDEDSFYNARLMNEKRAATIKVELAKLVAMKDSIEYYKLTPEQKETLCEDIDFRSDVLQSYEDKIYICQYMIDALEMMAEMYGKSYSDKCIAFIYLS